MVSIIFDKENNPWFKGKDICFILGYCNFKKALNTHVNEKYKLNLSKLVGTQIGSQLNYHKGNVIFISKPGLYEFIFSSKLLIALNFKSRIFEEVLPPIQKQGEYKIQDEVIEFYSGEIRKIVENKDNIIQIKHDIIQIKDDYMHRLEYITENAQETARIDVINHRNKEINNMRPNIVPQTQNKNLLNMFVLYRLTIQFIMIILL